MSSSETVTGVPVSLPSPARKPAGSGKVGSDASGGDWGHIRRINVSPPDVHPPIIILKKFLASDRILVFSVYTVPSGRFHFTRVVPRCTPRVARVSPLGTRSRFSIVDPTPGTVLPTLAVGLEMSGHMARSALAGSLRVRFVSR